MADYTKELEQDLVDILRRLVANIDEVKKRKNQTGFNKGIDIDTDYKNAVSEILKRTANPDMYRAIKSLLHGIERDCNESNHNFTFDEDSPLADLLRQAISKAEGKG